MVATCDGKLCARRIPTSYKYSAEMAAEIQKNDTIPVKRMYIVQFKGKRSEEYKVFVMDVPSELPDDIIRESLETRLGKDDILDIRINKDKREMCAVYISMKDLETAKKAIKSLNIHRIEGHPVRATWYYEHGPSASYKKNEKRNGINYSLTSCYFFPKKSNILVCFDFVGNGGNSSTVASVTSSVSVGTNSSSSFGTSGCNPKSFGTIIIGGAFGTSKPSVGDFTSGTHSSINNRISTFVSISIISPIRTSIGD